jgi:hypothetical protein
MINPHARGRIHRTWRLISTPCARWQVAGVAVRYKDVVNRAGGRPATPCPERPRAVWSAYKVSALAVRPATLDLPRAGRPPPRAALIRPRRGCRRRATLIRADMSPAPLVLNPAMVNMFVAPPLDRKPWLQPISAPVPSRSQTHLPWLQLPVRTCLCSL